MKNKASLGLAILMLSASCSAMAGNPFAPPEPSGEVSSYLGSDTDQSTVFLLTNQAGQLLLPNLTLTQAANPPPSANVYLNGQLVDSVLSDGTSYPIYFDSTLGTLCSLNTGNPLVGTYQITNPPGGYNGVTFYFKEGTTAPADMAASGVYIRVSGTLFPISAVCFGALSMSQNDVAGLNGNYNNMSVPLTDLSGNPIQPHVNPGPYVDILC